MGDIQNNDQAAKVETERRKINFYFTFGQKWRRQEHPTYKRAHPDGWVTIVASDMGFAIKKAEELFEQNYANIYTQEPSKAMYPIGEIERIEV